MNHKIYLVNAWFSSLVFQVVRGGRQIRFDLDPSSLSVAKVTQQTELGHGDTSWNPMLSKCKYQNMRMLEIAYNSLTGLIIFLDMFKTSESYDSKKHPLIKSI